MPRRTWPAIQRTRLRNSASDDVRAGSGCSAERPPDLKRSRRTRRNPPAIRASGRFLEASVRSWILASAPLQRASHRLESEAGHGHGSRFRRWPALRSPDCERRLPDMAITSQVRRWLAGAPWSRKQCETGLKCRCEPCADSMAEAERCQ
jgi:hypothetical protein